MAATHLINRIPSKVLNNKYPYEMLYNTPPDLQYLKVIGCQAYASVHTSDKFGKRAIPSILLGYPQHQKGYLLLAQDTKKVFVSRHVNFHEHIFPFHNTTPYHTPQTNITTPTLIFYPPSTSEPDDNSTNTTSPSNTTSSTDTNTNQSSTNTSPTTTISEP